MKFVSLYMHNWRPFHGDSHLTFSTDPQRPVTLLLGPNGAGKTAILNAFTWALYGQFTEGFDHPDQLVNLEALEAGGVAETWVELVLQHDEDEYRVRRATDSHRQLAGDYDLLVTKNGIRTIEDDIYRILPKALKDLFFFPAETFSTASVLKGDHPGDGTSIDVGTAIRSLLSGDIYDRASEDLRNAIESEALKPPKNYRDQTIEQARKRFEQAQEELSAAESRRDQLPTLLANAREQATKAKKEAERYNAEELRKWKEEHDRLLSSIRTAEGVVQRAHDVYVELARSAHMHFSQGVVATAIDRLDLAETAGLMPPRIHESVLDRSLEAGTCALCLAPLGGDAVTRVTMLRQRVGEAQLALQGLETRTVLKQYTASRSAVLQRLHELIAEMALVFEVDAPASDADMKILSSTARMYIDMADKILTKAKREFADFEDANVVETPPDGRSPIEVAMVKQGLVNALEAELTGIDAHLGELEQNRKDAFADYEVKSRKSQDYKHKTDAIAVLQEAKSYFDAARKGLAKYGREDFENAINETYSDLVSKPFQINVGDDFSITVTASGREDKMPLSQSEKVLLLIAFLGAIARLAPRYAKIADNRQQLVRVGTIETSRNEGFPVVLDAPTSPLDHQYEADVVSALPNLLPQIVVPVSAKSVAVWESIADRIGAIYIMELTSSEQTDRTVRWRGKDYAYSRPDATVFPARTRITSI